MKKVSFQSKKNVESTDWGFNIFPVLFFIDLSCLGEHTWHGACVGVEDNFMESVISLCSVGPWGAKLRPPVLQQAPLSTELSWPFESFYLSCSEAWNFSLLLSHIICHFLQIGNLSFPTHRLWLPNSCLFPCYSQINRWYTPLPHCKSRGWSRKTAVSLGLA